MATITVTPRKTFTSGEVVTPAKLSAAANPTATIAGITNAEIDAAAAIAFSKLAALDEANILVGNGSNVATKVAVTGDVTISNAGVTAIGSAKVTPTMLSQPLTLATAQSTTSGTSIDFTGIPSWAKRITVMLNGVSTNGSSAVQIQIGGSGGIETSGYNGVTALSQLSTSGSAALTSGFVLDGGGLSSASDIRHGLLTIASLGSNIWALSGSFGETANARVLHVAGTKTLSDALTQVRLTTANGTDAFDAGSVNIMYEG